MRIGLLARASVACTLMIVIGPQSAGATALPRLLQSATQSNLIGMDGDAAGFRVQSEHALQSGAAIVEYSNGDEHIKALGRPGSTIVVAARSNGLVTSAGVETNVDKSARSPDVFYRTKASAVQDLLQFGMSTDEINKHFPDLAAGNGPTANPGTANTSGGLLADATTNTRLDVPQPLNSWVYYNPPQFFDLQCVNYDNTTVPSSGYQYKMSGCSEIYSVQRNGADWYFVVRYTAWVYAPGEDEWGLGFENKWSSGVYYDYQGRSYENQIYAPTPAGPITVNANECTTMTLGINAGWVNWSVTDANVCVDTLSPWNLSRWNGGAQWHGFTVNQYRDTEGGFAIDNQPYVPCSYGSYYFVGY